MYYIIKIGRDVSIVILSQFFLFLLFITFHMLYQETCFSEFPIGNTAITVGLMERLKPGTMLLFCFEVPRDQKQ
jgi:hypothetical protein